MSIAELATALAEIKTSLSVAPTEQELRKDVNRFLRDMEPDYRRPGIHVTDLVDPCVRRLAWKILAPDTKDPGPDPRAARIFSQGKAIHEWWQNHFYGPMGLLIGKWECSGCGLTVEGKKPTRHCATQVIPVEQIGKPQQESVHCGGVWKFKEPEINFEIDGVNVTGNSDGVLHWREHRVTLEMKGIRPEAWKKIACPDPGHVFQASIYAPALRTTHVLVSYIDKETWDTKDYLVPVQVGAYDWAADHVKLAKRLAESGQVEQALKVCSSRTAARATRCGFASRYCFR